MAKKKTKTENNFTHLDGYIPANVQIPESSLANPNYVSQTQRILTYNYGEDIAKWGVPKPFTNNHVTEAGSILNLFDGDGITYYGFQDNGAGTQETTMIFDFNKVLEVRGILTGLSISTDGGSGGTLTTSVSEDGETYTQVDSTTQSGAIEKFYTHIGNISKVKTIKIFVSTTTSGAGNTALVKIYSLSVIV